MRFQKYTTRFSDVGVDLQIFKVTESIHFTGEVLLVVSIPWDITAGD